MSSHCGITRRRLFYTKKVIQHKKLLQKLIFLKVQSWEHCIESVKMGVISSKQEDKFIYVQSKKNCTLTAPKIQEQINSTWETPVSVLMVQQHLHNYSLKVCVATKKSLLCKLNKVKRLNWAKIHKDWATEQ